MPRRTLRRVAGTAAFALLIAACGQKPGVFVDDPFAGGQMSVVDQDGDGVPDGEFDEFALDNGEFDDLEEFTFEEGEVDEETGEPVAGGGGGANGGGGSASGGGGSAGGGGQQQGGGGSAGSSGGGNGGGGGSRSPQGSDRTGVTDDTITIAVHAPVTGAAPLPAESFDRARQTYWRWIDSQGEELPGGRDVEIIFDDDRFAPDVARQVCRQLAARAVLLIGAGGTDQIQACGQLAQQIRVPYVSPGVTEAGLEGNPWYFATSMTYKQQGPLLAQYVKREFGNARTAAVIMNTPNFTDGIQGWEQGVQREGINYFRTLRSERSQNPNFGPIIQQLQQNDVEVVYVNMTPLNYIQLAQAADNQGLDLQFVGVGVTMGLNAVLGSGCPQVDGGRFFSPFPALETVDRLDPDFRRASQQFGTPQDDIALAIWGLNKSVHEILKKYEDTFGDDITREDLRTIIENAGRIETNVFPPVNYSPQSRFGGTAVHVLKADCGSGQHRDGGTFETGF